jgi:hypothetical protein
MKPFVVRSLSLWLIVVLVTMGAVVPACGGLSLPHRTQATPDQNNYGTKCLQASVSPLSGSRISTTPNLVLNWNRNVSINGCACLVV